ncbi:hypothetical protein T492DRAFT_1106059 [Pavlovales sp. CCMP2436]|nr:hypothetical protein T492DRAFT_1106059 [Pavlovales sp. CCMP2436]
MRRPDPRGHRRGVEPAGGARRRPIVVGREPGQRRRHLPRQCRRRRAGEATHCVAARVGRRRRARRWPDAAALGVGARSAERRRQTCRSHRHARGGGARLPERAVGGVRRRGGGAAARGKRGGGEVAGEGELGLLQLRAHGRGVPRGEVGGGDLRRSMSASV